MKNNKKYGMYTEALRQTKTVGYTFIVILFLQLIISLLTLNGELLSARRTMSLIGSTQPEIQDATHFLSYHPMLILIGLLMIPTMFSQIYGWLGKRGESDFYHALPVKRSTIFLSNLAAIMTWCISIILAYAVISIGLFSLIARGVFVYELKGLGYAIICSVIAGLMIAGAWLIAKNLVSGGVIIFIVAVMIIYLPRGVLILFRQMVSELVPQAIFSEGILWNWKINILFWINSGLVGGLEINWGAVLYSGCLVIAYFLIAAYLFINRKSEAAGKPAINDRVQNVLRIIPACFISILPAYGIASSFFVKGGSYSDTSLIVICYIIAIATCFLYELVSTRSLSGMVKAARSILLLAIVNVAFIAGLIGYGKYLETKKIGPEEIKNVQIVDTYGFLGAAYSKIERQIFYYDFTGDDMKQYFSELINNGKYTSPSESNIEIYINDRIYYYYSADADWCDMVLMAFDEGVWDDINRDSLEKIDRVSGEIEMIDWYRIFFNESRAMEDDEFREKYTSAMRSFYTYAKEHDEDVYGESRNNPVYRAFLYDSYEGRAISFYVSEDFPESYKAYKAIYDKKYLK